MPAGGLVAIAIFIALNTGASLILHFSAVPSPYFPTLEPSLKTLTMRSFNLEGKNPDIIFIGSSVADMGFDVLEVEKLLAQSGITAPTFNFGVNGAGPEVFYQLLRYVIIPETRPKLIIYGLSAIEFNSHSTIFKKDQKEFLNSYGFASEFQSHNLVALLKETIFTSLPVIEAREIFWPNVFPPKQNFFNTKKFKYEFRGQQRILQSWPEVRKKPWEPVWNDRYFDLLSSYRASEKCKQKVEEIITLLKKNRIGLLIVNMPVLTEYDDLKGTIFKDIVDKAEGKNPQNAFEDTLRDVVSRTKTPFLDLGGTSKFEEDIFADPYHLNGKGAKKLSILLSRAILDILGNDL